MKPRETGPTAALAGIPVGLQAQGAWAGRRQLFVRFAGEAETATMYTSQALATEIGRAAGRSTFHSICIAGRDPLANADYIRDAFSHLSVKLPTMLDSDGQRPDEIAGVAKVVALVQVTLDGASLSDTGCVDRALRSLGAAAEAKLQHALVLGMDDRTSDPLVLRIVEQAHSLSPGAAIVVHPPFGGTVDRDRRWATLIERGAAVHSDIRLALRIPPPTGMR